MVTKERGKYIFAETMILHEKVDEAYEALMEGDKDAIKALDAVAEKAREIKADLLNREE